MINLSRSSLYYHPHEITAEEIEIMNRIDHIYTCPFYGIRKITEELKRQGEIINHKRIWRLIRLMGIQALQPRRNLSKPNKEHVVYPYLLKNVNIARSNQVWSTDIVYPDAQQFYLPCSSNGLV